MLHPSYSDLMKAANSEVETGENLLLSTAVILLYLQQLKRARQLIDGVEPLIEKPRCPKPLSIAVEELENSKIHILSEEEAAAALERKKEKEAQRAAMAEEMISFEEED